MRRKTVQLHLDNELNEDNSNNALEIIIALGGLVPYVGPLFDILSESKTVSAAIIDRTAINKIFNPNNFSLITKTIAKSSMYNFMYTVYEMYDDAGKVQYVGRTRQKINVRKNQHWISDSAKKGLEISTGSVCVV